MNKNLHKIFSAYRWLFIFPLSIAIVFFYSSFSNPTNINPFEIKAKVIKCYPNPATSVINFEIIGIAEKNANIEVYSFTGKKMIDLPFSSNKITIQLNNDFYRGIYIYQLKDKKGKTIETGKFQVEK